MVTSGGFFGYYYQKGFEGISQAQFFAALDLLIQAEAFLGRQYGLNSQARRNLMIKKAEESNPSLLEGLPEKYAWVNAKP